MLFENQKIKNIFTLIEKETEKKFLQVKSKYKNDFLKEDKYKKQDLKDRFQMFYEHHNSYDDPSKKIAHFPDPIIIALLSDPVNIIIENLASSLNLHNRNDGSVSYLDENTKKFYPLINKDQLIELPRLFRMLLHENSKDIKEWCVFVYIISCYFRDKKNGTKDYLYNTPTKKYTLKMD